MKNIIQAKNISMSFKTNQVLQDLSFSLGHGELRLLVGDNGRGKSTLLKILAGLMKPTRGVLQFDNSIKIAYSPAGDRDFMPNTSARDNLYFFARLYRLRKKEFVPRIEELCDDFQIKEALDSPSQDLSSGYKKKFSLVRCLMVEPSLLLLDEPLGPIDQESRKMIYHYLKEWVQSYKAGCLLSTHSTQDYYLQGEPQLSLNQPLQTISQSFPQAVSEQRL